MFTAKIAKLTLGATLALALVRPGVIPRQTTVRSACEGPASAAEPPVADKPAPGEAAKDAPQADLTRNWIEYHRLIKPQPDEATWAQIPWEISLTRARTKAAAEGKPILLWTAGLGNAVGNT